MKDPTTLVRPCFISTSPPKHTPKQPNTRGEMEQLQALPCLAVRPPLGVPTASRQQAGKNGSHSSLDDHWQWRQQQQQQHDGRVRPWICGLLVACDVLDVSVETQFTAAALFHRYHHALTSDPSKDDFTSTESSAIKVAPKGSRLRPSKDSTGFSTKEILAACLYLACKSEEEPRKMRDIINCMHQLSIHGATVQPPGQSTTKLPLVQLAWDPCPPELPLEPGSSAGAASSDPSSAPYVTAQCRLVAAEQHVLRWIAFDCTVSHPHRAVVLLCRALARSSGAVTEAEPVQGGDIGAVDEGATFSESLQRAAWRRVNAAVFSVACLSHKVWPLACAALDLELDLHRQRQGLDTLSHTSSQPECLTSVSGRAAMSSIPRLSLPVEPSAWYVPYGVPATEDDVRAARTDLEQVFDVAAAIATATVPSTTSCVSDGITQ